MTRWFGTVSMADIEIAFGLSRAQAHRVLRTAGDDPMDGVATGDATVFLDHLRSQTASNRLQNGVGIDFGVPVEEGDLLTGPPVREEVLKVILAALRYRRNAVSIAYSGREKVSDRIISPGRLVYILKRHHIRAWDHGRNAYRDFVLSRMTEARRAAERFFAPHDRDWEERAVLQFSVNPALPIDLRAALAIEWDLREDGIHEIECQKALARYVVREMTETTSEGPRRWLPADDSTGAIFNEVYRFP
jgi:WYL domain